MDKWESGVLLYIFGILFRLFSLSCADNPHFPHLKISNFRRRYILKTKHEVNFNFYPLFKTCNASLDKIGSRTTPTTVVLHVCTDLYTGIGFFCICEKRRKKSRSKRRLLPVTISKQNGSQQVQGDSPPDPPHRRHQRLLRLPLPEGMTHTPHTPHNI